jgi:hypothetical protein
MASHVLKENENLREGELMRGSSREIGFRVRKLRRRIALSGQYATGAAQVPEVHSSAR